MLTPISMQSITPTSAIQDENPFHADIDFLFDQLNPTKIDKNSDIMTPLTQFFNYDKDARESIAKALSEKICNLNLEGYEYLYNDRCLLDGFFIDVYQDRCCVSNGLAQTLYSRACDQMCSLTGDPFEYGEFIRKGEIINQYSGSDPIKHLTYKLGATAHRFGYLGKKMILEGAKVMLENNGWSNYIVNLSNFLLADEPSNVKADTSDSPDHDLIKYLSDPPVSYSHFFEKDK